MQRAAQKNECFNKIYQAAKNKDAATIQHILEHEDGFIDIFSEEEFTPASKLAYENDIESVTFLQKNFFANIHYIVLGFAWANNVARVRQILNEHPQQKSSLLRTIIRAYAYSDNEIEVNKLLVENQETYPNLWEEPAKTYACTNSTEKLQKLLKKHPYHNYQLLHNLATAYGSKGRIDKIQNLLKAYPFYGYFLIPALGNAFLFHNHKDKWRELLAKYPRLHNEIIEEQINLLSLQNKFSEILEIINDTELPLKFNLITNAISNYCIVGNIPRIKELLAQTDLEREFIPLIITSLAAAGYTFINPFGIALAPAQDPDDVFIRDTQNSLYRGFIMTGYAMGGHFHLFSDRQKIPILNAMASGGFINEILHSLKFMPKEKLRDAITAVTNFFGNTNKEHFIEKIYTNFPDFQNEIVKITSAQIRPKIISEDSALHILTQFDDYSFKLKIGEQLGVIKIGNLRIDIPRVMQRATTMRQLMFEKNFSYNQALIQTNTEIKTWYLDCQQLIKKNKLIADTFHEIPKYLAHINTGTEKILADSSHQFFNTNVIKKPEWLEEENNREGWVRKCMRRLF